MSDTVGKARLKDLLASQRTWIMGVAFIAVAVRELLGLKVAPQTMTTFVLFVALWIASITFRQPKRW